MDPSTQKTQNALVNIRNRPYAEYKDIGNNMQNTIEFKKLDTALNSEKIQGLIQNYHVLVGGVPIALLTNTIGNYGDDYRNNQQEWRVLSIQSRSQFNPWPIFEKRSLQDAMNAIKALGDEEILKIIQSSAQYVVRLITNYGFTEYLAFDQSSGGYPYYSQLGAAAQMDEEKAIKNAKDIQAKLPTNPNGVANISTQGDSIKRIEVVTLLSGKVTFTA